MDEKEREKRETPIIDGDARPDMPIDPEKESREKPTDKKKGDTKFETERVSDVNSLEDYKDAK
jgi:hypothetical protein